jgi:hypothetical protein
MYLLLLAAQIGETAEWREAGIVVLRRGGCCQAAGPAMTQKESDAADVTLDLLAIQSNALEAIRDYSRYLRNAENAGLPEVPRAPAHRGRFGPRYALSGPVEKAGQHGERPAGISACQT